MLAFATSRGLSDCLDPILAMTRQHFPTAIQLRVTLELDPELHNVWSIDFDVQVREKDVPDFVALGVLTDGDATNSRSEADYADFVLFDRRPEPDIFQSQLDAVRQLTDAGTPTPSRPTSEDADTDVQPPR